MPEVPVIVTVTVPVGAVPLAASVSVLVLVALLGLKDAVTPFGSPEAIKLTLPPKPLSGVMPIVFVPLAPRTMLKLLGEAESEKSGTDAAVTVREIVTVCVKVPDEPLMVTMTAPVVAVLLAVKVKVLVLVVLLGLKDAVTPFGSPEAVKLTLPLKPFNRFTLIVLVPMAPCARLKLLGDAERVKSGVRAVFVVTVTLSKVAVARLAVLPLLTPRPT